MECLGGFSLPDDDGYDYDVEEDCVGDGDDDNDVPSG